ncbi:hypothetical protein T492DRAFT_918244, partial [Pavlovales sp. CCMP2436]
AAQASSLTTHKRTHSGERPFACDEPGCEHRAIAWSDLKKHQRTHARTCDEPNCEYAT